MKLGVLAVAAAMATGVALAIEERVDEQGRHWWKDPGGTEHQLLYLNSYSGEIWGGNFRSTPDLKDPPETLSWNNNAVFVYERNTSYSGDINAGRTACGFYLQKAAPRLEGGTKKIGAFGIISEVSGFGWPWYPGNGYYELTASQTWSGPAAEELSTTPFFFGPCSTSYYSNRTDSFRTADDISLQLAGDMIVMMYAPSNDFSKCDIVIHKPALLSLMRHWHSDMDLSAQLKARSITFDGGVGMYFGTKKDIRGTTVSIPTGGSIKTGIGSEPIIDPVRVSSLIQLKNGATLTATEATTVSGGVTIAAIDNTESAFVGSFQFDDDMTVIRVDAGATLDLRGCTISGGAFTIVGGGTVKVNLANLESPFTVDTGTKVDAFVAGEGRFFMPDEKIAPISGDIVVESGTMVVANVASIPAGGKVVTQDDSALMLIDATGFDPETKMGGTKKIAPADPLIVTDAPRTGVVRVGAGETIEIWGDGLGTDATLFAANGATVLFRHNAEIAAGLLTSNAVNITASDSSVVGLVSGAWTSLPTDLGSQYIELRGPGTVRFSGGAELRGSSFWMRNRAQVEIVENTFNAYVSLNFKDGHLTIKDGGKWQECKQWIGLYMNQYLEGSGTAVLELGKNGVYWRANNSQTIIGQSDDSTAKTAKLYINGGYFETAVTDAVTLNGNGIIEIDNGGYMSCECSISGGGNKPRRVILGDGVWGNEMIYSGQVGRSLFQNGTSLSVEVKGNMLFDVGRTYGDNLVITNVAAGPVDWTFREGSTCRVRGRADAKTTFVLRDVTVEPGARFDLGSTNPVADVKFDLGGKDSKDLALTWVVPPTDVTSGKVIGDGGALAASYYVPSNGVFNAGDLDSWHEGFGDDVTINDLTFEEGSTFLFPYFGSGAALVIGGKLTLPTAANYRVDVQGPKTKVENATILTAADGIDGDCTWTCVGGVRKNRAKLEAVEDSLLFSYDPLGALLLVR